jgi:BirA family biotin operon repressor/biotin-[acetyl-CoA-carboxylase] ligase
MTDRLSQSCIQEALSDLPFCKVQVYDELVSTNLTVREAAKAGASESMVVIADQQTGGYGRYGRSFCSPNGTGLYMSVLLRPEGTPETALLITTAAAVAVAEAIEELTGRYCGIKWVNDLILDGKKVCGILTEGALKASSSSLDYAILGIGINVTEPTGGFPADIQGIAGAILTREQEDFRNRLAATVLRRFFGYYWCLATRGFFDAYRQRLFFLGQPVRILGAGREESRAVALDIDGDFRLLVRYDDGREEALSSGEIGIRL